MLDILLIAKLLVSIGAVLALSLVAEHVSPRVAGVLSGYPLGTAIALFFIGVEQGDEFAAASAEYTLAGFTAALVLTFGYYQISRRCQRFEALLSPLGAITGFLLAAALLHQLALSPLLALLFPLLAVVLSLLYFRHVPNVKVTQRVRLSHNVLLLRALIAAAIVLLITGIAAAIGPAWSGLLSAFPITLFPFMLIMHLTYGKHQVHTIIKNYPYGLGSLIIYALSVTYTYPAYGVYGGTALALLYATLYLIGYTLFSQWHASRLARRYTRH